MFPAHLQIIVHWKRYVHLNKVHMYRQDIMSLLDLKKEKGMSRKQSWWLIRSFTERKYFVSESVMTCIWRLLHGEVIALGNIHTDQNFIILLQFANCRVLGTYVFFILFLFIYAFIFYFIIYGSILGSWSHFLFYFILVFCCGLLVLESWAHMVFYLLLFYFFIFNFFFCCGLLVLGPWAQ